MIRLEAVVTILAVSAPELVDWIARGWVEPGGSDETGWTFTDLDLARAAMIRSLRRDLDLETDTVPLVLSLLDQVYALRGALRRVAATIEHQPDPVRAALLDALAGIRR